MTFILRTALITLLFIIGSFAVSAQSGPKNAPAKPTAIPAATPAPAPGDEVDVTFPDIDGWSIGEKHIYPTVDLGYSVPYRSDSGITATIYVYTGGNKKIPNDLSGVVQKEFDKAKQDIFTIGKMGRYQNVKEVSSGKEMLAGKSGKVNSLHALLTFDVQGEAMNSHVYLFAANNEFIKVRITQPASSVDSETKQELADLLKAIDALFAK